MLFWVEWWLFKKDYLISEKNPLAFIHIIQQNQINVSVDQETLVELVFCG